MLALVVIGPSVFFLVQSLSGLSVGIATSTVVIVIVAGGLFLARRKKHRGEGR